MIILEINIKLLYANFIILGSLEKNGIWYDSEINGFKCRIKNSSEEMNAVTCRRPNECAIMMEKLKLRGVSFYIMEQILIKLSDKHCFR